MGGGRDWIYPLLVRQGARYSRPWRNYHRLSATSSSGSSLGDPQWTGPHTYGFTHPPPVAGLPGGGSEPRVDGETTRQASGNIQEGCLPVAVSLDT